MRKLMVVADETPESFLAMRFAAQRARRTSGRVVMLAVLADEIVEQWINVAEVMRAEAMEAAKELLAQRAEEMRGYSGVSPEGVIREGSQTEAILDLINEDREIDALVLGAKWGGDDPGSLVTQMITKMPDRLRVPVAVVPGHMTMEEIDAVC